MNIHKNKKYVTKYIFDTYLGLIEIFGVNGSSAILEDASTKNCTTVSGGSPNKPCIFSWKYNGKEYQTCTLGLSMSFCSNFISIGSLRPSKVLPLFVISYHLNTRLLFALCCHVKEPILSWFDPNFFPDTIFLM